jgi:mannose-1-phosphate guanylyltransferase / phosphomannomutase
MISIPQTAVILAGGKGTRLGSETRNLPKPMIDIDGKPLLQLQLEWLKSYGIKTVYLLTGHLTEVIHEYFEEFPVTGVDLQIIAEAAPLGTAGALGQLRDQLKEPFWVVYGDLVTWLSLDKIFAAHEKFGASHTLIVHPNDHPYDSDLVIVDSNSRVTKFLTKPHPPELIARNLVNAAVYLLSPSIFNYISETNRGDLARDIFPNFILHEKVFAYSSPEYLKDMGTPDRLARVRNDWKSGKVKKLHGESPRPTVFLDRDGVVIEYVPEIHRHEDVKLRPGVAEAIQKLNRAGILVVVATNQPMIAKGLLTPEELDFIHAKIETLLGEKGAWIDKIYYCPHHPDKGFEGERPELKLECRCRKPNTGMLEQACEEFKIDRTQSWMIGDTWRDIECGQKFGLRTLGIKGGAGYPYSEKKKFEPEAVHDGLASAVEVILPTIKFL